MTETNESGTPGNSSVHPSFLDALRRVGTTALDLLRVRVELVSVEWQEQRERGKEIVMLAAVAALLLAMAIFVLTLFVLVLFWDSYRLTAIAAVGLAYLGGGVWALQKLQQKVRERPPPLATTLQEFANDLKLLRREQITNSATAACDGAADGGARHE